jgi:hypothetical protein
MPQAEKTCSTPLTLKEREDCRVQPWRKFMAVTHTSDTPLVLGDHVRLLGQRVNAHVG